MAADRRPGSGAPARAVQIGELRVRLAGADPADARRLGAQIAEAVTVALGADGQPARAAAPRARVDLRVEVPAAARGDEVVALVARAIRGAIR